MTFYVVMSQTAIFGWLAQTSVLIFISLGYSLSPTTLQEALLNQIMEEESLRDAPMILHCVSKLSGSFGLLSAGYLYRLIDIASFSNLAQAVFALIAALYGAIFILCCTLNCFRPKNILGRDTESDKLIQLWTNYGGQGSKSKVTFCPEVDIIDITPTNTGNVVITDTTPVIDEEDDCTNRRQRVISNVYKSTSESKTSKMALKSTSRSYPKIASLQQDSKTINTDELKEISVSLDNISSSNVLVDEEFEHTANSLPASLQSSRKLNFQISRDPDPDMDIDIED